MVSKIAESDLETLKRIGVNSVTSLALVAPARYYDFRIKAAAAGERLFFAEVEGISKNAKTVRVTLRDITSLRRVEAIFFNFPFYYKKRFSVGARLYLYGKTEERFGRLTVIQPKAVSEYKVGKIFASYKTSLRENVLVNIIKKYVSVENLISEGVKRKIAENVFKIHFPDEEFFRLYLKERSIPGPYLKALKYLEIFDYLKRARNKRINYAAIKRCEKDIKPFLERLPFELTGDQRRAIEAIALDLKSERAARRIVVGDVGSGKSVLMFAAAYIAAPRRSILMVPTTVLADQLYREAKRFLAGLVEVSLVTSKESGDSIEKGELIIGTHALLYRKLPKACLVMVDEQHRFGTAQRAALSALLREGQKRVHYIQFSATPIPRTQAMIESAMVDFSFLRETPFKREVVTQIVSKEDFKRVIEHIRYETQNDRQVLIVYPLVQEGEKSQYKSIEEAKRFWESSFEGVYFTHGKDPAKEKIIKEFASKGKILLSTTVVEVGISLPRLSTVVIVGAEKMGLATLHQLRGRVARNGLKGYCFLYTHNKDNERLKRFCKLKSGFEVAELDLKFRKSGDLLSGKEQSGKSFRWIDLSEDLEIIKEAKSDLSALLS